MTGRGRTWRWLAWLLGLALLVGVPVAVVNRPVADADLSADALLDRVRAAEDHPWSGLAETVGSLQVPSADGLEGVDGVAGLFGESTRLRAWWRGDDSWRVDRLLTSGEEDLVHDGATTTSWDYEDVRVRTSADPDIRLPRTADLLPPELGARALAGDVVATRTDPRRVAGVDAVGLRVEPAADADGAEVSSVDHVLVWADPGTGVPLEVEVYGAGEQPVFTTRFVSWSPATPDAARTAFEAPPGADVSFEDTLDIADAANQYAPLRPPRTVGGLERRPSSDGAVGVYGTGLAQVIAIPLRDDDADALREQLLRLPGVATVDDGTVVAVDVLGVALTGQDGDGGYLVAGTVRAPVLVQAMDDILTGTRYVGDDS